MAVDQTAYVVVASRPWLRPVFDEEIAGLPGEWHYVDRREALTPEALDAIGPRYVFFLHWSWHVPAAITSRHECVAFHMTDVPFGRGGSPLQNLIARGHEETVVSALRMVDELDAGPVYGKERLLLHGSAEAVYVRAGRLAARMIADIVREQREPEPQQGEVVVFRRRTPEEGRLSGAMSLDTVHDWIRMLDAEGYPPAFVELGDLRLEFTRAVRYASSVRADVTFTRTER